MGEDYLTQGGIKALVSWKNLFSSHIFFEAVDLPKVTSDFGLVTFVSVFAVQSLYPLYKLMAP